MSKYFHKKTCRLCGDSNLSLVLSLGETPLANSFVRCEDIDSNKDFYPLDVFLCESCGHAQLLDVVDPKQLFDNYLYVSGTSSVFVQHFKDYAKQVKANAKILGEVMVKRGYDVVSGGTENHLFLLSLYIYGYTLIFSVILVIVLTKLFVNTHRSKGN